MLLDHSELRVTADLYTHLVKQTAEKAAQRMDAVLGGREVIRSQSVDNRNAWVCSGVR